MSNVKTAFGPDGVVLPVGGGRLPRVWRRVCHVHPFAFRHIPRERRRSVLHQGPANRCVLKQRPRLCPVPNTTSTTGNWSTAGQNAAGQFMNETSLNPIGFYRRSDDGRSARPLPGTRRESTLLECC